MTTDDRYEGPFVPDTVLAEQLSGGHTHDTGERRLLAAVLEDAVHCCLKLDGSDDAKKRALGREAWEWIASTDRSRLYTFENVCLQLGLDPDYVRGGVSRMRRGRPAARAPQPGGDDQLCAAG
jgi:hypothetical protein